tara:strand:+ start:21696 stop:22373 length:678 start_codon:yes stop_codon:yes gene_type:complete
MTCAILICRPQPGADATAKRVRAMGMEAILYPLFTVAPLAWEPPEPKLFDAVMFTSANALRHGGQMLERYHRLPAFAVGRATAEVAEAAGFDIVSDGGSDVQALVNKIYSANYKNILHLCGADVRAYDARGLHIRKTPVYRTTQAGDAIGLAEALHAAQVLLAHSPRAGERLATLTTMEQRRACALLAISQAALQACGNGWRATHIAETPDDASMLALAWQICQR